MKGQREVYFNKYCKDAPDAKTYLDALKNSPYRTHRRMFVALLPKFKEMIQEQQKVLDEIKEVSKNET